MHEHAIARTPCIMHNILVLAMQASAKELIMCGECIGEGEGLIAEWCMIVTVSNCVACHR